MNCEIVHRIKVKIRIFGDPARPCTDQTYELGSSTVSGLIANNLETLMMFGSIRTSPSCFLCKEILVRCPAPHVSEYVSKRRALRGRDILFKNPQTIGSVSEKPDGDECGSFRAGHNDGKAMFEVLDHYHVVIIQTKF